MAERDCTELEVSLLQLQAQADYEAHRGRLVRCRWAVGYRRDTGDSEDILMDPPGLFRVWDRAGLPTPENGDLKHWCDEVLDPYWDLELLEDPLDHTRHAELDARYDSFFWYGTSYSLDGWWQPNSMVKVSSANEVTAIPHSGNTRYPYGGSDD